MFPSGSTLAIVNLQITGTARAIHHDVRVRVPKIQERVAVSAANKATRKVFTQTVRDLSKSTGIKQQVLRGSAKNNLKGRVKHYKFNTKQGRARVWVGLRNIPLVKVFNGKRMGAGVGKFAQYTSGSMPGRSAADVFIAKMPTGHEGYFVRRPGAGRLGIQEVKLDIKAIGEKTVRLNGRKIGAKEFKKEYDRDLKRRLKRK